MPNDYSEHYPPKENAQDSNLAHHFGDGAKIFFLDYATFRWIRFSPL